MDKDLFEQANAAIRHLQPSCRVGRVIGVASGTVQVGNICDIARVGDRVMIKTKMQALPGQIIRLNGSYVDILTDSSFDGISIGDKVLQNGDLRFAPNENWIGRVIDPDGNSLDEMPLLPGMADRRLQANPPPPHQRRAMGKRLETNLAVFNTLLPIVKGQRIGLFAGSGVGKSTLLANLARSATADVIVIGLVGERGREVRDFVENVLGVAGMERSVVIAATSDRPSHIRHRCALAAMSVAEYFRDQGKHVLLLLDSVTRFCEAHRELAVANGESTNLRGYPASTGPSIANLCERAGPGIHDQGDITAIFSVLVAGSDMEEPVADMLRGVLDGHIILDREIAEKGQFPAIDVLRSVSRSLPDAASEQENKMINDARTALGHYDRAALMIQSGLYTSGSDPNIDNAIKVVPQIEAFLQIADNKGTMAHFTKLRQTLTGNMVK